MRRAEERNWIDNIESVTEEVCKKYGAEVAASVYARYDAQNVYDLNEQYLSEVFADLYAIAND